MYESTVLRRVFGPKRDEITGELRRLQNEELCDLYCFSKYYLVDQIQNNEMDGHAALMGERRVAQRVWWVKLRERDNLEDLVAAERII